MDDIEKNDNMGAYELGGSSCPCENFKCPCAVTGGLLDQQYDCDIPTGLWLMDGLRVPGTLLIQAISAKASKNRQLLHWTHQMNVYPQFALNKLISRHFPMNQLTAVF